MESSVPASFQKDGKITLILQRNFASFDTAQRIEDEINGLASLAFRSSMQMGSDRFAAQTRPTARAIDQLHVEVEIPELYRENPIKFISVLLDTTIQVSSQSARVVINEREGVVVIGKDVELAPVLIAHRNLRIEAGGRGMVPVGESNDPASAVKLKALADALNALDVPTTDLIEIIKTLQRKGDLYGEVVFQ